MCAPIPVGRGLGFSGAVRVAGIVAAHAQRFGSDPEAFTAEAATMLALASELEGHADNVAASLHGGVVAVAGGRVVRLPLARSLLVVLWVPDRETSTATARRLLPGHMTFDDAAFNVGRTALLMAALAAGEVDALRTATEDRLHQDRRLSRTRETRVAMEAALGAGAFAAWLSGSGPSAAAFVDPAHAQDVASAMPSGGRVLVVEIAEEGARVT